MNFNLYNSILFAGILQGFIFVFVVLFNKKYNHKSNFYLAALISSFSFNNLQFYIPDIGVISREFFYNYVYIPWCLIIPVFFYLYIVKSLYPENKISFKQKLLFVPFYIGLFFCVLYKLLVLLNYRSEIFNFFDFVLDIIEFSAIILNQIIYIVVYHKIKKIEKEYNEYKLDLIKIKLNWLKKIVLFLFILTIIWLFLMVRLAFFQIKVNFYPLWIGISLVTYWLGYIGIYKFGVIEERKNLKRYSKETKATYSIVEKQKSNHIIAFEHLIIEQKRFLDSDLTLENIAQELNLSKSYLSRIINSELGTGFVDYVNNLRINEAKSYLLNPDFSNYTLESIGIEAGFNSKSAFYSSFKKVTGQTPTEFKKESTNLS